MVILGIDPGYGIVGYGVIEGERQNFKPLDYGVIKTPADESLPQRLDRIVRGIELLTEKYKPDAIAIEELFFQNNQKTAIAVAEARGVILHTAYRYKNNLYEYTPMQIKMALTGYGKADKRQIQEMVKLLLKLKSIPKPDDAADALAVAMTHAQTSVMTSLFKI